MGLTLPSVSDGSLKVCCADPKTPSRLSPQLRHQPFTWGREGPAVVEPLLRGAEAPTPRTLVDIVRATAAQAGAEPALEVQGLLTVPLAALRAASLAPLASFA